jgi:putative intracellular protease/amidase
MRRILMVVTSHDRIDDEHPTGLWLEEFAVPYDEFRAHGYLVTVASPRGGPAPVDPKSRPGAEHGGRWREARQALVDTHALEAFRAEDFDAVFLPGGHGTMFDFPDDPDLQDLLVDALARDCVVAAVCHGPAALVHLRDREGRPLVRGRRLTAFTDAEEREVGLADKVPFLLETVLRERGAEFVAAPNWSEHVERDGLLVTGQNPQSSAGAARAVVDALETAVAVRPADEGRARPAAAVSRSAAKTVPSGAGAGDTAPAAAPGPP